MKAQYVLISGGTSSKELAVANAGDIRDIFIYLLALFFILKLVFKDFRSITK